MVSLRVLESLFVRKNSDANSVASVPGEKVELDPSRYCEDVLRCILLEMSASNLKTAMPDMLKWDVLSFIMKKRSILPKCHLQQFKDAIVKSTNPFSTSLKERSGLELGNHYRDSVTADAIDSDGFNQGHEIGGVNTRRTAPTENLDTSTQGNKNGLQVTCIIYVFLERTKRGVQTLNAINFQIKVVICPKYTLFIKRLQNLCFEMNLFVSK